MEWPCGTCDNVLKKVDFVTCDCELKEKYRLELKSDFRCNECKIKDVTIEIMSETIDELERKLAWYEKILYGKGEKY